MSLWRYIKGFFRLFFTCQCSWCFLWEFSFLLYHVSDDRGFFSGLGDPQWRGTNKLTGVSVSWVGFRPRHSGEGCSDKRFPTINFSISFLLVNPCCWEMILLSPPRHVAWLAAFRKPGEEGSWGVSTFNTYRTIFPSVFSVHHYDTRNIFTTLKNYQSSAASPDPSQPWSVYCLILLPFSECHLSHSNRHSDSSVFLQILIAHFFFFF